MKQPQADVHAGSAVGLNEWIILLDGGDDTTPSPTRPTNHRGTTQDPVDFTKKDWVS